MSERNIIVRGLHDLGLGAWFGGSLAEIGRAHV